jgi:4'-phosphopantetheinyl transferase
VGVRSGMHPSLPPAGEVHLWCLPQDPAHVAALCEEGYALLPGDERAHYNSLSHPRVAQRFLSGRILLRQGLAHYLGAGAGELVFSRSPSGKPLLVEPQAKGLAFNLSHAPSQCVLAVAGATHLGVDLEPVDRADTTLRIARRFFSQNERQWILSLGDDAARHALMLWTLKEGVVKAMGETVWDGLEGVQLTIEGEYIRMLTPPSMPAGNDASWTLTIGIFRKGYLLALAAKLGNKFGSSPLVCRSHVLGEDAASAELFRPLAST